VPKIVLPNFSKGEIAPSLYGRIDTAQYSAALKTARNWIVRKYGGVTFRSGTRLVGKADDPTKPIRLIPFQFSISQSYVLVMGNGWMRPTALGGFVLEQDTKITAVIKGATTTMTVPFHGYEPGDRLYISGVEGMTELNGRFAKVLSVPNDDTIVVDIDSTNFSNFTSSDGTENTSPPAPPPAPPPVQPPYTPPPPPGVGGGGGYDYHWKRNYYHDDVEYL
jgi:hypothetical protein